MHIAYLVPRFPVLSETFVSAEVDRLRRAGMRVSVYTFELPAPADRDKLGERGRSLMDETIRISRTQAILAGASRPGQVLRLGAANRHIHEITTMKSHARMRLGRAVALARRFVRDGVTHVHAHWPYAAQVAWLVNRLTGLPYSVSVHAHEVAHDAGHFPEIFKTVAFAAFCNGGAMRHLLGALPATATQRAHLVYHGVDISQFRCQPIPDLRGGLRVLSAGRLTPTKGFDRLLRGCAALRRSGVDVRLTVLGRGAQEAPLRALARELDFADRLSLPGWVEHSRVQGYLADSHLFALLADTSFHDGLPNVALEAMAVGRPVVLSALPAADEAVSDGVEGFVLRDHEDPEAFSALIRRMGDSPARIGEMGLAARRRVTAEHDADRQILELQGLFEACHGRTGA